jgi:hypothetical protein
MNTLIQKRKDGYTATTTVPALGALTLKLSTYKNHNGVLVTSASCFKKDGFFESHRVYQDFNQYVQREKVRVTEKAVISQHTAAKENIAAILDSVKAYYTNPEYVARYGKEE